MIHVNEVDSPSGVATDIYFERTGKIRENLKDCTRDELQDLATYFINSLEDVLMHQEKAQGGMEKILGWRQD
jgi:hypothetical protein